MNHGTFLTYLGDDLVGEERVRIQCDERGAITDSWIDGKRVGDLAMLEDHVDADTLDRFRMEALEAVGCGKGGDPYEPPCCPNCEGNPCRCRD